MPNSSALSGSLCSQHLCGCSGLVGALPPPPSTTPAATWHLHHLCPPPLPPRPGRWGEWLRGMSVGFCSATRVGQSWTVFWVKKTPGGGWRRIKITSLPQMAGTTWSSPACGSLENRDGPRWTMEGEVGHWQDSSRRLRDTLGFQIKSRDPRFRVCPKVSLQLQAIHTRGMGALSKPALAILSKSQPKHPSRSPRQGHMWGIAGRGLRPLWQAGKDSCQLPAPPTPPPKNISSKRSVFLDRGCSGQYYNSSGTENQLALISGEAGGCGSHSRGVGGTHSVSRPNGADRGSGERSPAWPSTHLGQVK
jgi:hypothetical protein